MSGVLRLSPEIREKCNASIVITGVARSGTTILGKLIHSMKDVEYVHEPPLLFSLIALIDNLDRNDFELLYETYLYEEIMFNALAGRSLNCNLEDDTSIYKVKDKEWIQNRLSHSLRMRDAEKFIQQAKIVYKMPDIVPYLPKLQDFYPGTQVVMMLRNANDVFHSILEKEWFEDEMLRTQDLIWPNRIIDGLRIPYWVLQDDYDYWCRSDALHRAAYYYVRVNEGVKEVKNIFPVRYDEFVLEPKRVITELAKDLNLQFGPITLPLIGEVKKKDKDRERGYLERLKGEIKNRVLYHSQIASFKKSEKQGEFIYA